MSDPLSYEIPTDTVVECDVCERENRVTYWDHARTGHWVRESFTCDCGEHHSEIDGNREDRGATGVLGSLFLFGLAITLIGCGVGSDALIIAGAALMVPAPTIGAIAWIERNLK